MKHVLLGALILLLFPLWFPIVVMFWLGDKLENIGLDAERSWRNMNRE